MTRVGLVAAVLSTTSVAWSAPRTTTWLEDTSLEPADSTETRLVYEHPLTDVKAPEEGIDLLSAELHAGVGESFELAPLVVLRQRGEEATRLHQVGVWSRFGLLDLEGGPRLLGYAGYFNDLGEERDHLLRLGAAASADVGPLWFHLDARPSAALGGDRGKAVELWLGGSLAYAWQASWTMTAGLETFLLVPLVSERLSDPTFGEAAESKSWYYGPALSFGVGPVWATMSAVTGYFVSTPASQVMLRAAVGVNTR